MGKTFRREKNWDDDYSGFENRSFKNKKKKMKAQRDKLKNTRNYDDHEDSLHYR